MRYLRPSRYGEEIKYPFSDGQSPRGYKIELHHDSEPARESRRPVGYKQEQSEAPLGYQAETLNKDRPSGYQSELANPYQDKSRELTDRRPSTYQRELANPYQDKSREFTDRKPSTYQSELSEDKDEDLESYLLNDPYAAYEEDTADYILNHKYADEAPDGLQSEFPSSYEQPTRDEDREGKDNHFIKASPYGPLWKPLRHPSSSSEKENFRNNIGQR